MDIDQFDRIDKLADDVYNKFEELHQKGAFVDIENKMKEICSYLNEKYAISVSLDVEVFSEEKERSITLVKRGLACSGDQEPYLARLGSTAHRYVVNGQIVKLL